MTTFSGSVYLKKKGLSSDWGLFFLYLTGARLCRTCTPSPFCSSCLLCLSFIVGALLLLCFLSVAISTVQAVLEWSARFVTVLGPLSHYLPQDSILGTPL